MTTLHGITIQKMLTWNITTVKKNLETSTYDPSVKAAQTTRHRPNMHLNWPNTILW